MTVLCSVWRSLNPIELTGRGNVFNGLTADKPNMFLDRTT
jgi:hypothetical protein